MDGKPDGRTTRHQHRRGELVQAVAVHLEATGVAGVTLRSAAAAAGVSHATLVHHFGTRERLLTEIVEHVLDRTLVPDAPDEGPGTPLRSMWRVWTSEAGRRDVRLFIALVGHSMYEGDDYRHLVQRSLERRRELMERALIARGRPADLVRTESTAIIAQLRGLMIDLLVTGDEARVEAAAERLFRTAEAVEGGG